MSFLARLLAAALLLPPPYYLPGHEPETALERAGRIELIVTSAMAEAEATEDWPGTSEELAAALLSVTWYESRRWALEVHEGRVKGDNGSSVCLAQIWSRDPKLVGTSPEATRRCFRRAANILTLHAKRCGVRKVDREQMTRLLGAYGTGRTCHAMPWARQRSGLWASLMKAAGPSSDLLTAHRDDTPSAVSPFEPRRTASAQKATATVAASP